MEFSERLKRAAAYAKVEWSPTEIGKSLGRPKQTVARWMADGTPSASDIFMIADRWKVDARWLATEEGAMLVTKASAPGLDAEEQELLERYGVADERWRQALRAIAELAAAPAAAYHTGQVSAPRHHQKTFGGVMERTPPHRSGRAGLKNTTAKKP